ncbi:hypothetical protein CAPTEDRAFT_226589 [Capitella teleta]|uniref:PID domain-containing protein n=1 Tax=Capitella teleta TaxID=283909 RepID=R7T9E3_CAPTE|nr:hypothetical protein CAPTEDRAFT_226589 [Capitella teleta]|eukprot:ELT87614.1 hypothetical protein CAPTEDRAFT_226589 [Capitella teleta]
MKIMSKNKGAVIEKAHYYVQYLGWKESKGLGGREFTEPIVKDLVIRRQAEDLPKLTIEVSKKELKIYQVVEQKRGKPEKIKYPTVAAKDLTYATQGLSPDEDVVACIYLGFNPNTRSAVHVHVYRFDSRSSAELFVKHLTQIISIPEHQERLGHVEEELVAKGQITPRPRGFVTQYSDGQSTGSNLTYDQDLTDEDIHSMNSRLEQKVRGSGSSSGHHAQPMDIRQWESNRRAEDEGQRAKPGSYDDEDEEDDVYRMEKEIKQDTLAAELRTRLGIQKTPILLPPKDYDTVSRAQGNIFATETRRSQNEAITGSDIDRRGSGPDSARGDSDNGSYRHSDDGAYEYRHAYDGSSERLHDPRRLPSAGDEVFHDNDLIPVSPRWKTGAQYMPPPSGRPVSPVMISNRPRSPPRGRPRSPGRDRALSPHRRAMSPQASPIYDYQQPMNPVRPPIDPYRMDPRDPRYPDPRTGKKYTAANLGIADPKRGMRHSGPDEGYISIDRQDPYGNPYVMGSPHHNEGVYNTKEKPGKKDKKDKKNKKDKKGKWAPGDDVPVDYTLGPAVSKNFIYK